MTRHSHSGGMLRAPGRSPGRSRREPGTRSEPPPSTAPQRDEQERQQDLASLGQATPDYRIGDAAYRPLIAVMLFIGVASIGLAIWFVYMREYAMPASSPVSGQVSLTLAARSEDDTPSLLSSVEATRNAQQIQIAQLEDELASVRQELASIPTPSSRASTPFTYEEPLGLDKPPLALILDVPLYKQEHSLSCESSAAAMAANFFGLSVSESDILHALPRHENPHLGFRGNVDGPYGGLGDYGVYAEPVRQVLVRFGLDVEHLNGGAEEIKKHIREGRPVIAWVTYRLQAQSPRQVVLADPGLQGGARTVTMVPYEHTVLVVGYNREGLWVNDPYEGTRDFYTDSAFDRSFAYLDNMALVVGPPVADGFR